MPGIMSDGKYDESDCEPVAPSWVEGACITVAIGLLYWLFSFAV